MSKYDTYTEYNDIFYENDNNDDCDEIENLQNELEKYDEFIDSLWKIILDNNHNVLTKISEYDKDKFYNFMINNSSVYKNIKRKINLYYSKNIYTKNALDTSISK